MIKVSLYNKRANYLIYHQNTLIDSLLLLTNMLNLALSLIQPDSCAVLSLLIENDLQKQCRRFQFQSGNLPTLQKVINKNEIKGCRLQPDQQPNSDQWVQWISPTVQSPTIQVCKQDPLMQKIRMYNKCMEERQRSRRECKSKNKKERKPRKTRTTITQAILNNLNSIFAQYMDRHEKKNTSESQGEISQSEPKTVLDLKAVSQLLELSYSTILTKYRQFKATRKVKGGILLASQYEKRRYKKSLETQELIKQCLYEKNFYTVVELKEYIMEKFGQDFTRSKISRHLGEMGYSFRNMKRKAGNIDQITKLRKQFALSLKLKMQRPIQLYYLDQLAFSFEQAIYFNRNPQEAQEDARQKITVMVFASEERLISTHYLMDGKSQRQFARFFIEVEEYFLTESAHARILIMNAKNHLHYSKDVMEVRKRLIEHNVLFYYEPPFSRQLNILYWLYAQIQDLILEQSFTCPQHCRDFINEAIKGMMACSIQTFVGFMRTYLKKCQQMEDF